MNRKQKIIVSVTGLFLVLLILMGLTYAYFLTRITGNTNDTSISVTTENLALVYGDDDGSIIGDGEIIEPGTTFETKTFSVTNVGTAKTDYVVVIEDVNVTWATDGTYTDEEGNQVSYSEGTEIEEGFKSNDFTYTLMCESYEMEDYEKNGSSATKIGDCNGAKDEILPIIENGMLVGNSIDVGMIQVYSFELTYKDTKIDQSADMNKVLSGRLNINDISSVISYSNSNTLAYNILKNSIVRANGTTYSPIPLTVPAAEMSSSTERVLSTTQDDYGISYYYRGTVEDNYINFAGMCWRIVRIEGDGSVKLILEDYSAECNSTSYTGNWSDGNYYKFGYDSNYNADFLNFSGGIADALKSFQINKLSTNDLNKLKIDDWCYDDSVAVSNEQHELSGAYTRLEVDMKPSLICAGTKLKSYSDNTNMYVGSLTADEMSFAGITKVANSTHYLINDYVKNKTNWFGLNWCSLSLYGTNGNNNHGYVYVLNYEGYINAYDIAVNSAFSSRPAVTLITGILTTKGEGTKDNPYVIN